jgi:hypothetical protein
LAALPYGETCSCVHAELRDDVLVGPEAKVRGALAGLLNGEDRGDAFDVCDEVCSAAPNFAAQKRGANLYLVWINVVDWTTEPGSTEKARAAIPRAAAEWPEAEGDSQAEHHYFERWFRFHNLGVTP